MMATSTWIAHIRATKYIQPILIVGSASYIIYLFHTTFEGLAKSIVQKVTIFATSDTGFVMGALLCILAGIVGPIVLFYIIRKFQMTRMIFGLK